MDSLGSPVSAPLPPVLRDRALGIIATATLLALLYFARDVLAPITLAFILSLLVAPLVRALRRVGFGQTWSVMAAVLLLAVSFGAVATVIGSQLVHMASSLPQYEKTIRHKLETLNSVTLGRVNAFTGQADAGERLSRFFVSQFAVNFGVGLVIWLGLSIIGLPHPLLWAALTAVLRFVPYIGVWIAALCAVLVAAAVDVSWSLTFATLGLFVVVELIAGQLLEPQLFGHTTGLSPLSVVIAAIFWSWLWGPIGLIVSTPLTLCLLVAGRHIKALSLLDILLGDTQALTMPQRFYQRALSADSDEIIAGAREFLKRNSFANYCDLVLMPALHLARLDLQYGVISTDQQIKVRSAMVAVIAAIGGDNRRPSRRRLRSSVLDKSTAGRQLRQQREQASGRWQGPLTVKIDARHMSLEDLSATPPPSAAEAVSMVYVVSAFPSEERNRGDATAEQMRQRFPQACIVAVLLPGMLLQPEIEGRMDIEGMHGADKSAASLGHAVQICLDMHRPVAA
jgi:predicted PurR-regulated permease PerM